MSAPPAEPAALPARDRYTLIAALAALAALAWVYLWVSPMPMPASSGGLRTSHYALVTFLMWFVMMIGMMVPSVAPTVLLFDRVARRGDPDAALARTAPFVAGYLLVWALFSIAATALQVELIAAGWLDAMGWRPGPGSPRQSCWAWVSTSGCRSSERASRIASRRCSSWSRRTAPV